MKDQSKEWQIMRAREIAVKNEVQKADKKG